jgi:hypothetical protein
MLKLKRFQTVLAECFDAHGVATEEDVKLATEWENADGVLVLITSKEKAAAHFKGLFLGSVELKRNSPELYMHTVQYYAEHYEVPLFFFEG